ncbi:MAG: DNA-processing protein DprA, partial [Oscillospiraceae bacterium]
MKNVEIWLWILLVMLPHNSRTAELLRTYGSALEAAKAMRDGSCTFLTPQEKQRVERTRTREVRALINECQRLGISIVTLDDEDYPKRLKQISDPPIVLFVKGSLKPLERMTSLSVVGPRQPS